MAILITKQIKDALIALIKAEVSEFDSNVIGFHKTIDQVNSFPICMIYYVRDDKDLNTVGAPELGRVQGDVTAQITIYTSGDTSEDVAAAVQKATQDAIENNCRLNLPTVVERTVITGSELVVYQEEENDTTEGIVQISSRTTYDHPLGNS